MFNTLSVLADILQIANYEQNLKQSEDFEILKSSMVEIKEMLIDINTKVENISRGKLWMKWKVLKKN